jgi:aryl-alcohol dehydrogenase-like predicted oxidoreductase
MINKIKTDRVGSTRLGFTPSRLTLGAAQLGFAYGVANAQGQPAAPVAMAILDAAWTGGVRCIDTAPAYGDSEERVGAWRALHPAQNIRVATKIPPTDPCGAHAVETMLEKSRASLRTSRLDLVLAHRGRDLLDPRVLTVLRRQRDKGLIGAFGGSVYETELAMQLLEIEDLAALQVPVSITDRRFIEAGVTGAASSRGVAVFARSIFLQGTLVMAPDALPANLSALGPAIRRARLQARDAGRALEELLLVWARDQHGIASLVVGAENPMQIAQIAQALSAPRLSEALAADLSRAFDGLPRSLLDPRNWPKPLAP